MRRKWPFGLLIRIFLSLLLLLVVPQPRPANAQSAEANGGSYHPTMSADGRYVAFVSDAYNLVPDDTNYCEGFYSPSCPDIFVHDGLTGQTERISVASDGTESNMNSGAPSISANGRYVAFSSDAGNLVNGDTNWATDVFL